MVNRAGEASPRANRPASRVAAAVWAAVRRGGGGAGAVPADIPDGSDDDIVARQLREAAMKEKDPELRARLWEEYRQYKKGS